MTFFQANSNGREDTIPAGKRRKLSQVVLDIARQTETPTPPTEAPTETEMRAPRVSRRIQPARRASALNRTNASSTQTNNRYFIYIHLKIFAMHNLLLLCANYLMFVL